VVRRFALGRPFMELSPEPFADVLAAPDGKVL
jgi:hypothetical protein